MNVILYDSISIGKTISAEKNSNFILNKFKTKTKRLE